MKRLAITLNRSLGTVAVCSVLAACGGSGGGTPDRQALGVSNGTAGQQLPVVANDESQGSGQVSDMATGAAVGGEQSLLLEGQPISGAPDLIISNATFAQSDRGLNFSFDVADGNGGSIDLDSLSLALEVAGTGSFADSYRITAYDIRESGENQGSGGVGLTARSTDVDLPSGRYDARLVVNPNWQNMFDSIPKGHNEAQPFRYISESDYKNNASNIFQIDVNSSTACAEDRYENNDSAESATAIPVGTQIEASLCLDDVDIYSLSLSQAEVASLIFAYSDEKSNPNPATRYVVLDSNFNRITQPTTAREANRIVINARNAGQYYLVLFGKRSSYRITRAFTDLANDYAADDIFHTETISGPQSWLFGGITLQRLAFTEATLRDQVVNCGRVVTQFDNDQPVAYVTPDHFAEVHEFRFLSGGGYLVDGERHNGWHIQDGDISHADWYSNSYPGYAENVSDTAWRYWSKDGLGYVDCKIELNK